MTADEVTTALLELHEPKIDFTVSNLDRSNARTNGFYRFGAPGQHEIFLYGKNFTTDDALFWTAMHEYAHHIMVTERGATGTRSHTNAFWAVLHELAGIAEAKGLYTNPAKAEGMAAVNTNLTDLIRQSGELLKSIGRALIEAQTTCKKAGVRFEDYVMRDLKQTLPWATMCMKAAGYDLPAELGEENIKMVAAIKSGEERAAVVDSLEGELSPHQIKAARAAVNKPEDVAARLELERKRLAHTIANLSDRLEEVEAALENVRGKGSENAGDWA
jgi:hypothetical protein